MINKIKKLEKIFYSVVHYVYVYLALQIDLKIVPMQNCVQCIPKVTYK